MAGNFPDSPSRRMAIDDDGTVETYGAVGQPSGNVSDLVRQYLQDETDHNNALNNSTANGDTDLTILFPELREVDGQYVCAAGQYSQYIILQEFYSSVDATNGADGTWVTEIGTLPDYWYTTYSQFRTTITSMALTSKKAVRIRANYSGLSGQSISTVHLYGTLTPAETPDRILYLDTLNSDAEFTKPIDYAEVPRGQTQQRTVKIKNNSATKTINTIQMTAEDLYLNAGGWYTFSLDDSSYQATLNTIGNLGPGDTKLIYVKQEVPDAETLGVQTARLRTTHASLT